MLLKRHYAKDQTGKPVVAHFEVKHSGASAEQNFSHRFVEQGMADGLITVSDNTLTIKAQPEDLVYSLQRTPGYYCRSSGQRIPISDVAWIRMRTTGLGDLSAKEAKAWLIAHGKPQSDYEVTNAYECVLVEEQHAKYRAVAGPKGQIAAAHIFEGA